MTHVITSLGEFGSERLEQRRVRRRIGWTQIVHRLDQAATEEMLPHAVDNGASEKGIIRRSQPGSHWDAAVITSVDRRRGRTKWLRRKGLARFRMIHFAASADVDTITVAGDASE